MQKGYKLPTKKMYQILSFVLINESEVAMTHTLKVLIYLSIYIYLYDMVIKLKIISLH